MDLKLTRSLATFLLLIAASRAFAQIATLNMDSTIQIAGIQTYCQNSSPYLRVNLLINGSDIGRPGLIYVAAHNPDQTAAEFLSEASWVPFGGVVFTPYLIARSGLQHTTITIPLLSPIADASMSMPSIGWSLYVGYGALSAVEEAIIQKGIEAVAVARAYFPDRQIPSIDPDDQRRAFIQRDMTSKGKFHFVAQWTPQLVYACRREIEG